MSPTFAAGRLYCASSRCLTAARPNLVLRFPNATTLRAPPRSTGLRSASTASEVATDARSLVTRLKNLLFGTTIIFSLGFGYLYITDTRSSVHRWVVVPALRTIFADAEEAHWRGLDLMKALHAFGLHPRERGNPDAAGDLSVEVFGHVLDNPVGTSAGIMKNGEIASALLEIGPAIVEVGGVTPYPQEGNPKPRVFRIPSQNALINRYGLNSEGAEHVAMKLRQRVREFARALGLGTDEEAERTVLDGGAGVPPGSLAKGKLMAVQIAKNKITPDGDLAAVERDYVYCVEHLGKYADVLVVNVSSPNTPGLRDLQNLEPLTRILTGVVRAAREVDRKTKPAVMVKVSPDEDSDAQVADICEAVHLSGVDGVIVGNTTRKRPEPLPRGFALPPNESSLLLEQGGYSGPQMFERTLALVKRYRRQLDDGVKADSASEATPTPPPEEPAEPQVEHPDVSRSVQTSPDDLQGTAPSVTIQPPPQSAAASDTGKVIFATGGITNGKQALEVLNAGASVAMVYTAMVYSGVGTISRIKGEMRHELRKK